MAEYAVGIATKKKIYETAKQLFYDKGIKKTSYADICAAAEVNRGLIPYYFKGKSNIAIEVLGEFFQSMEDAVIAHWGEGQLDPTVWHVVVELLMFRLLQQNRRILDFYGEIFGSDDFHEASLSEQALVMRDLAKHSGVTVSDEALQTIICMVNGVEGELVLALKEGLLIESVEDFVRRDMLLCHFLLGADVDAANRACDEAFAIAAGYTFSCGADFACKVVPMA